MSQRNYNRREAYLPTLDTSKIIFSAAKLDEELFSEVASETAKTIAGNPSKHINKSTQLRRFYDEIVMWEHKTMLLANIKEEEQREEKFTEMLPFIKMINAKVAYAEGRKLVDSNYVKLMSHCLSQVKDQASMKHFKLFMEAFMGFYKLERPK
jgi:CRISPR-associated protein Csm2